MTPAAASAASLPRKAIACLAILVVLVLVWRVISSGAVAIRDRAGPVDAGLIEASSDPALAESA